jgi:hypothetical protein
MIQKIINRLSIIVSLTIVLGVFMHDTKVDDAVVATSLTPALVANYTFSPVKLLSGEQHIHTESSSFSNIRFSSQQPAAQPRNEDDKKYINSKRLLTNNLGNEYIWPST